MVHILIMPRQGNTVESCIIGEWMVKEGDAVQADTLVCVVETNKATFEVPAGGAGTVLKILHPVGDDVPVLQPIMAVGNPGENWEAAIQALGVPAQSSPPEKVSDTRGSGSSSEKVSDTPAGEKAPGAHLSISPRAKNLALAEAVNPADLTGTGPGGRIIERDVAEFVARRAPLTAGAKEELRARIAAGLPADIPGAGSGLGGRITAADLKAGRVSAAPSGSAPALPEEYADTPIKGIRKVIADQMMKSHTTTAAFTLNSSAPAVNLQGLRVRFKAAPPELGMNRITVNDLVLFAVSRVLPRFPYMNAHKLDERIRIYRSVHLGVAVSTPRGLMVPVIRNADKLSLGQISRQAKELAEACRSGSISPDDLHGSTFTVSNLGNTGIDSFSPVINIPEVAILGVCSIRPQPVEVSSGQYEMLPHLGLSLTIDHAVVDGAPAAEFVKALCGAIKDIDLWLAV